jgi:hypothetical protein
LDLSASAATIYLSSSDDNGMTWREQPTVVSEEGEPVALDPATCAAVGDDVWIAYGLSNDDLFAAFGEDKAFPRLTDILVAHSGDGGKTISLHTSAMAGASSFAMHPMLAQGSDKTVHLAYYTGRDRGDTQGSLRRTWLRGGETSFHPAIDAASPITFDTKHSGPAFIGDFLSMGFLGNALVLAYGDNASGDSHIVVRRIDDPVPN